MYIFRFLIVVAVAIQFLTLSATQAQAWEFSMSGSLMWTYETYSQQGLSSFFGPHQGLFWNGISRAFPTQLSKGDAVAVSYLQGDFWPTVKINQAIDVKARLRLGGYGGNYKENWNNDNAYQYRTWSNPGTLNDMGLNLPLLWATARTPWGSVVYGKRPMPFGTGLQYDGDNNLTSESILLKTYYGPFIFALGFYPPNYHHPASEYYSFDGIHKNEILGAVVYSSGNLEMGVYESYFSYHIDPLSSWYGNFWSATTVSMHRQTEVSHGTAYVKYTNGRFFLNAEAAWLYDKTKYEDVHCPTYVEQWRYMTELGVLAGPTKLGFLFALTPGLDRRNGMYIDRQPASFLRQPTLSNELAGITLWRQYAYLLPYVYGSGLAGSSIESTDGYNSVSYDRFNCYFSQSMDRKGEIFS